jgi:hypothetical protein
MKDIDDLFELVNAEIVKQAQDILALGDYDDYDNAIADMVERLTAVWYSGYEFGMEDRLAESLDLELDEEAEL